MVSVLVSVGAVTWCGVMHRAALDKGPAGAERQEVATSCNSVRFGAQTSKGIRNPMLYPLELRAHRMLHTAAWIAAMIDIQFTRDRSITGAVEGCSRCHLKLNPGSATVDSPNSGVYNQTWNGQSLSWTIMAYLERNNCLIKRQAASNRLVCANRIHLKRSSIGFRLIERFRAICSTRDLKLIDLIW